MNGTDTKPVLQRIEVDGREYSFYSRNFGTFKCQIQPMMFTWGLLVGMFEDGSYEYRYCYPTFLDALQALVDWDGEGLAPGPWLKLKGRWHGHQVDFSPPTAALVSFLLKPEKKRQEAGGP